MANAIAVVWVLIAVVIATTAACLLIRKHEDKNLIRTCIIATAICLYSMWAITYMAQANPLIQPKRVGWAH